MEEVDYFEAAILSMYILAGIAIWMHVVRTKFKARTIVILSFAVLLGTVAIVIAETILAGEQLAFREFLALDFLFSMLLYVVLCEALLSGGSQFLTKWRGDKWAKELDYPYLILGGTRRRSRNRKIISRCGSSDASSDDWSDRRVHCVSPSRHKDARRDQPVERDLTTSAETACRPPA